MTPQSSTTPVPDCGVTEAQTTVSERMRLAGHALSSAQGARRSDPQWPGDFSIAGNRRRRLFLLVSQPPFCASPPDRIPPRSPAPGV
ncbi:hypothetical protein AAFF_G00240150 [Aldrovandia affinis]|uniref:Uncharacterized protein n=1 Tax=Aldrovandia affinis TaxID=143900 RepID=A0AAD7SUG2_9TELE|nr:hypothetical protein AAFF_G00240150 [Aldrovandia affinis]